MASTELEMEVLESMDVVTHSEPVAVARFASEVLLEDFLAQYGKQQTFKLARDAERGAGKGRRGRGRGSAPSPPAPRSSASPRARVAQPKGATVATGYLSLVEVRPTAEPVLGIDPGISGGLAILSNEGMWCAPMPMRDGNVVDIEALLAILRGQPIGHAIVERQQDRRGKGEAGVATKWINYGRILSALELAGVPYYEVHAALWHEQLGLSGTGDTKQAAVQFCEARGYDVPMTSERKDARPHDGIADAYCLAAWGIVYEPKMESIG